MEVNSEKGDRLRRVGLVYDDRMCKHATADGDPHPENPDRIRAIWKKLESAGIPQRCVVFNAKEAEDKHILSVHSNNHVNLIKNISSKQFDSRRNRIASKFNSIYMNEGSSEAAYLAAGSVIEVAERVAKGELSSAFAIVRPPGHHAEQNEPMGFCLYNNVAIATSFLLNERPDIKKILIVDWDVHHGNGTQKMFWKDPRVLFFSVHRHEFGSFYPANDDGFYAMTGEGPGAGYNINVPWENGRCGDADYLAVWDHILIPVAKDFNPDIVIISAGFDAAIGDPLGGCHVTPYGYSVMLKKLMEFSEGKIIMALEGGYNLVSLANSVLACVEVLLEDKPIAGSSEAYPFESTWRVIQAVRQELSAFWPTLADELPKKLTSCKASPLQVFLQLVSGVPVKGPAAGRSRLARDLKSGISGRFQDRLLETIEVSCSSAQEGHPEIDGEDRADPVLVPDEGSPEDIQPAVNEEGPASREEPHHNDSSGGSPVDDAACTSASPFSYVELGEMLKQIPPGSDVALPSAKMFEMAEMLVSGIRGMVQQRDLFSDLLWITDHMKAFISHRMSGEEELRSRLEQAEANLKRSQDNNEALRIELEEAKSREAATEARLHEAEDKTAQLRGGVRQLRTEVSIEKKQKEDLQLRLIAQKEELEAEFVVQREELETEYQKQVDEMYFFGYHCCMKKNGIKRDVPSIPPGEEEKLRRKPSQ